MFNDFALRVLGDSALMYHVYVISLIVHTCDFAHSELVISPLVLSCVFALSVIVISLLVNLMFSLGSSVIFDPLHNSCCDLDIQKNTELAKFSGILEFRGRIPIQKALTDQRPLYRSHIDRF
ncbi:hypothetical protein Hanom_Chr01g00049941 [Helianthus anomalus]